MKKDDFKVVDDAACNRPATEGLRLGRHTAGPWMVGHFADDTHSCNCTSILSERYAGAVATIHIGNGKPIGDGANDAPPLEEAKANGRLIAAAPAMFTALRSIVDTSGEHVASISHANACHDARELLNQLERDPPESGTKEKDITPEATVGSEGKSPIPAAKDSKE